MKTAIPSKNSNPFPYNPKLASPFHTDGVDRPLTEDEIMEQINQPDVEYEDDGSVWLYYKDQKLDITDRFEDGICYVKLTDGKDVKYLTIKYNDGYAMSDSKYVSM